MKTQHIYISLFVLIAALFLTACDGAAPATPEPVTTPPTPAAGTGSLQKIQDSGVLRVAVNPGIAPMEFERGGEIVGFDVDLAEMIAEGLGVQAEIILYEDLESVKNALIEGDFQGNYDVVISSMGIKDERLKNSLAVPYFKSGVTILTSVANEDITDLQSLSGHTVGAVVGSGEHREAGNVPGVTIVDTANYDELVRIQEVGAVDASVLDVPVALLAAKRNDSLRVVPEPFEDMWYGIYMEGQEIALFEKITEIIREFRDSGEYDRLYAEWF